jgi:hypothetical protein
MAALQNGQCPEMADCVRSPPAAPEHSSSLNVDFAERLLCRKLADRIGSGFVGQLRELIAVTRPLNFAAG